MKARIVIDMDNAAFCDGNRDDETARILRDLADRIEAGSGNELTLRDINGNTVGKYTRGAR